MAESCTSEFELQRFDVFEATFEPLRRDDLKDRAVEFIGRRLLWEASWLGDEDGPVAYEGMWQCWGYSKDPHDRPEFSGWVPDCDLVDRVLVRRLQGAEELDKGRDELV